MKWRRIVGAALGVVALLLGSGVAFLELRSPAARPLDLHKRIVATPSLIERGRYIVDAEALCMRCHTERDYGVHGAPDKRGFYGAGWDYPSAENGVPGRVFVPNITSDVDTGIGGFPDDAIIRAVREGVGYDGRALFMMPWQAYRGLSDRDMEAVVAYLRTVPPVRKRRERTEVDVPVRWFLKAKPLPLTTPVPDHDATDPLARGRHLATVGLCRQCHTPVDARHEPRPGMDFAGGRSLVLGGVLTRTTNITPHASGIAHYAEALFLQVMRTGDVGGRRVSPVMPWYSFRYLTDADLHALWAYLQSVPPVANDVPREPVNVRDIQVQEDDRQAVAPPTLPN